MKYTSVRYNLRVFIMRIGVVALTTYHNVVSLWFISWRVKSIFYWFFSMIEISHLIITTAMQSLDHQHMHDLPTLSQRGT